MIQKIILDGEYLFSGDLNDLKRCLSSFKITKVICEGEISGVKLCEVHGKFRYHGQTHRVHISKHWGGEKKLFIRYRGTEDDKTRKD